MKVTDIQNAYIIAPVTEKIWTVLGREVGEDYDMKAIVVRSLCGMKSAGAAFRNHLADCIHHMELLPCPDDPDLWVNPMIRPEDGFKYYAYVLKYVYDVMVIHHDAESELRRIDYYFKLNTSSIGNPNIYLVAKLKKIKPENRVWAWANRPSIYVKESVVNVESYLAKLGDARWQLPNKKSDNPFLGDYSPEMDETPPLEQYLAH